MTNTITTIARVVTSEELDSIGKGTSSAMSMSIARATNAIARVVVTAMARVVLIVAVRVVSEVFAEVAATMTRIVLDEIAHGVAFMAILSTAMWAAVGFSVREWWRGRSGGEGATEAAGAAGEATPLLQSSTESNVKAPPRQASRLWHLDDVKVSLTSIVVMHHVGCAFAEGGFYVTVGNYETSLSKFSRATAALDQSYFMVRAHATPAHPRLAHACTPTKSRHGLRKAALRRCQCAVPHNARTRPCLSTC